MLNHVKSSLFISLAVVLLLTGCGGKNKSSDTSGSDTSGSDTSGSDTSGSDTSGSDTSGSDTSGSDTSGSDTSGANEAYNGSRSPVPLTMSNSRDLTLSMFEDNGIQDIGLRSDNAMSNQGLPGLLKQPQFLLNLAVPYQNSNLQQRTVESAACTYGGTITLTNDLDDTTNLGSATFDFSDCRQDLSSQIDGELSLTVSAYNSLDEPSDFTLGMSNLSILEDGIRNTFTGTIHGLETSNSEILTTNLSILDHSDDSEFYFQNYELVDGVTDSISGRLFDGIEGYIDLSSSSNLMMSDDGIPTQGYIYIEGSNGSKARISNSSGTSMLLELDKDGDGTYEQQEIVDVTS